MNNAFLFYINKLGKTLNLPSLPFLIIIIFQIISIIVLTILLLKDHQKVKNVKEEHKEFKKANETTNIKKDIEIDSNEILANQSQTLNKSTANLDTKQGVPATSSQLFNENYYHQNNKEDIFEDDVEEKEEEILYVKVDQQKKVINKQIIYHIRSFKAKLCQANDEIKDMYEELVNHILSYNNITNRIHTYYESYRYDNQTIARITITRKILCLYIPIIPNISNGVEDVSHIKKFQKTPMLLKITNKDKLNEAKYNIKQLFAFNKIKKNTNYRPEDIKSRFPMLEDAKLKSLGLIEEKYYNEICDLDGNRISLQEIKSKKDY